MDSGLYLSVFGSWEVILTALLLMFLLPLVFYVASMKSRPRKPATQRAPKRKFKRPSPVAKPAEEPEDDERAGRQRRAGSPEPKDDEE